MEYILHYKQKTMATYVKDEMLDPIIWKVFESSLSGRVLILL